MLKYATLSNKLLVQQSEPHFKYLNLLNIPFLDELQRTVWHFEDYKGQILKDFGFLGIRSRHLRPRDYAYLKTYFTFKVLPFPLDKGTTSSEFDTHRTAFWEMGNAISNFLLLCSDYDSRSYSTEQNMVIVPKNLRYKYKTKHNRWI